MRPPSSSSSLLHRVILRLAKNQTYDVVKGTAAATNAARPPFYPHLSRHEQPPAFEFISVALHTTPPPPPPSTQTSEATPSTTSPRSAPVRSFNEAAAATMSDDEFDERVYDAIINGDNTVSPLSQGRQVQSLA